MQAESLSLAVISGGLEIDGIVTTAATDVIRRQHLSNTLSDSSERPLLTFDKPRVGLEQLHA